MSTLREKSRVLLPAIFNKALSAKKIVAAWLLAAAVMVLSTIASEDLLRSVSPATSSVTAGLLVVVDVVVQPLMVKFDAPLKLGLWKYMITV